MNCWDTGGRIFVMQISLFIEYVYHFNHDLSKNQIYEKLLVQFCDLVAPLVLISRQSKISWYQIRN